MVRSPLHLYCNIAAPFFEVPRRQINLFNNHFIKESSILCAHAFAPKRAGRELISHVTISEMTAPTGNGSLHRLQDKAFDWTTIDAQGPTKKAVQVSIAQKFKEEVLIKVDVGQEVHPRRSIDSTIEGTCRLLACLERSAPFPSKPTCASICSWTFYPDLRNK